MSQELKVHDMSDFRFCRPANFRRRDVVGGIVAAASAALVGKASAAPRIVVWDYGGSTSELYRKAFYDPFASETGIVVVPVTSSNDPAAQMKSMVETRNYAWDIAMVPKRVVLSATDYIEELGQGVLDDPYVKEIPGHFKSSRQIGTSAYATILGYRTDKYTQGPGSWADLFDTRKFPGRRALRKTPFDTIEQALLADGVKPADLYPCDFDRAFKKLGTIKKEIVVWWSAGAQASQLLKTGEIDMMPMWNSRATAAMNDGAPAKIVWNQGLYSFEGPAILKGSPNAEACRELVKFCARPDRQALLEQLTIGPTNPGAYQFISRERAQMLPTSPDLFPQMVQINEEFWAKARSDAQERFNAWLLS